MNDLKELYISFIEHLTNLNLKNNKKSKILINNISNAMNLLDFMNNNDDLQFNTNALHYFVNKMDNIFTTINEKKKLSIVNIESFSYFLKCLKLKSEDINKFLNLYETDNFQMNLCEIGEYLLNNDKENYNVFYNHFLLLYIEVCNFLYNENEMPEKTNYHYNLILNKFTEDSFNHDTLGENVIELIILIVDNIFRNNTSNDKYNKIIKLLNDPNLSSIINQIVKINMSDKEFNESNEELKRLSKQEITDKITFYSDKLNNLNIMKLIETFDIKNLLNGDFSSLMNLMSQDVFGNLSDVLDNVPNEILDIFPSEMTSVLNTLIKK